MSKFKVGDRIRVLRLHPYSTDITVGETYQVKEVFSDGDIYITDDVGDLNRIASKNVEPVYSSNPAAQVDNIAAEYGAPTARFKVGDRVRYTGNRELGFDKTMIGKLGTVTKDDYGVCVGVDWEGHPVWSYGVYRENLERVGVAPANANLRIEAGKFYKTRDGRKVGPMVEWSSVAEHPFEVEAEGDESLWRNDGTSRWDDTPTLIAEWTDEPVAAPAAKFNVGDRVGCNTNKGVNYVVRAVNGDEVDVAHLSDSGLEGSYTYRGHKADIFYHLPPAVSSIADIVARHSQTGTAIVCLLENGKPAPATRPFVHTNPEAAATEADRLANAHKGQEFGVYTLGEVRKVQKVYDFGWQNLAMSGRKIEAIKNLRADNGLTLKGAKDAVEHWVASQAA